MRPFCLLAIQTKNVKSLLSGILKMFAYSSREERIEWEPFQLDPKGWHPGFSLCFWASS